ncbi:MAG: bacteriocin immunity protein [Oscillospiraceae bacterium]|nr:bacteriocin immunity protein [Oscillospiraceae bacterium]
MSKLTREELVELVESIMTVRDKKTGRQLSEQEHCDLINKFRQSIDHPGGSDLIYYPQLIAEFAGLNREPTVDEIVDLAIKGVSE